MNIPRTNWFLFIFYLVLDLCVLIAAVISPPFRDIAQAPLRDLVLPLPSPIIVTLQYSTEKEAWLEEATDQFYATNPRLNGHPIKIEASQAGSREIVMGILDGKSKPTLISPASSLQISILQNLTPGKFGHPLVNTTDRSICRPVLNSPLVLVAWRERAEVLWGKNPGPAMWMQIHEAVQNPRGWATYQRPDWGYVKFGHTSPLTSNSGFMTIVLMTSAYFGNSGNFTSENILTDEAYQKWFLEIENNISDFGDSTGTYMKDMIAYGPSVYDFIAVYEATAIEQADNALGRNGAIQVYYPPETVISDHPFCILQADWVEAEEAQAAKIFLDFLLSRSSQEMALTRYGFRPADSSIPLDLPGSPFGRYANNGLKIDLQPQIALPSGDVLNTLLDFWTRNVNH